jgi:RNA-directed DNA polymerase
VSETESSSARVRARYRNNSCYRSVSLSPARSRWGSTVIGERTFARQVYSDLPGLERLAAEVESGEAYSTRQFKKKSGGVRTLRKPEELLALVLKKTNEFFNRRGYVVSPHAHGFVKGKSTATNAALHLSQDVVVRLDIADFFESITATVVEEGFTKIGFDSSAATLARRLTTVDGSLPIGFATSPFISNLVFEEADIELAQLAEDSLLTYSRYADDMVFSGRSTPEIIEAVRAVLRTHSWELNDSKTRWMRRGASQYVTGLSVSDPRQPRIPKALKRRMRWKLHMIQRVGYDSYMSNFDGEIRNDQPHRLLGLARYIAGVEPHVGLTLLRNLQDQIDASAYGYWSDDDWSNWVGEF